MDTFFTRQLLIGLLIIGALTSCTVNLTFTSTHGKADDIVDLEEKQQTTFDTDLSPL